MTRLTTYLILIIITLIVVSCHEENSENPPRGSYLGQEPPGDTPEIFAPGIICNGLYERDVAMTPDGKEMYFGVVLGNNTYSTIIYSKQIDGQWTSPEVAAFCNNPKVKDLEPFISPDGKKFLFVSNRTNAEGTEAGKNWDIWVMDRAGDAWGKPYNLGEPISSKANEFFPTLTNTGTIYFTREGEDQQNGIYRSELVNGSYIEPERLPEQVNCGRARYNASVAADESYMIVPAFGGPGSFGGTDYYIVFRNKEDQWSEPINMGDLINSASGFEWSAYVSPDGKYLFFMSVREDEKELFENNPLTMERINARHHSHNNGNPNIYWMSAKIIETLREQAVFKDDKTN